MIYQPSIQLFGVYEPVADSLDYSFSVLIDWFETAVFTVNPLKYWPFREMPIQAVRS